MEWIAARLHDDARDFQFDYAFRAGLSGDAMTATLGHLGEDRLLARLLPYLNCNSRTWVGAGDDCAVLKFGETKNWLLLKSDCVVEGIHFESEAPAAAVGWKAMMRALSDFAAMSGIPQFALVTLAIAHQKKMSWVEGLYRGLNRAAALFRVAIVGGETSDTGGPTVAVVCVAGFTERRRCVLRSGGKANDDLFVTGQLGGSRRVRHLKFVPRIEEARWLTANFKLHAMIDLSDGLGADLPRLAHASKLGFSVDKRALPVTRGSTVHDAICDGEDYELLFAISRRERNRLEKMWRRKFPKVALTRIGRLHQTSKRKHQTLPSGYVHFRQRR